MVRQGNPAPRSFGELQKWVRTYSRTHGLAESRVRDWLSYMMLAGALENPPERFTFKGGVALELRLPRGTARATRDLDLTFDGSDETQALTAFDAAIVPGYGRFKFRRTRAPHGMPRARTLRLELQVRFDGNPWGTITVDLGLRERHRTETELVDALELPAQLGLPGPERIPCLSVRYHLAHKIHAVTAPPAEGWSSERVQDAVDIMLLQQLLPDLRGASAACRDVFAARETHAWPPPCILPEAWADAYRRLATDARLPVTDLAAAVAEIARLIHEIDSSPAQE